VTFPLSKLRSKGTGNNKMGFLCHALQIYFELVRHKENFSSVRLKKEEISHTTEENNSKQTNFHVETNFHSHVVIGCKREVISLMELGQNVGVELLVTFQRIALMICSRPLHQHHIRSSNIDSFLLIDVCRKFKRKLRRRGWDRKGKSQFTHEEFGIKLIFLASIRHGAL
jgi:hypothetical protein